MNTKKTGMVLGKFLPLHNGHVYLIEFAQSFVDELTVVVGTLKDESIPGELRYQWVKDMFPKVNVVHLRDENPQHPHEHPGFWDIWKKSLERVLPNKPNYVFASEAYGAPLAKLLDAEFIPCDESRSIIPISGTNIRNEVYKHWNFLPRCVRPYFTKKVCILGPESTGKSTLSAQLAEHYQTNFISEYARTYLEAKGRDPVYEDMEYIGKGQRSSLDSLIKNSNKVVFSDTDIQTTKIWSQWLFSKCPDYLNTEEQDFDLYLLLDVDVPWVDDAVRFFPERRQEFFDDCRQNLDRLLFPYEIISGDWKQRFDKALIAVDELFKED